MDSGVIKELSMKISTRPNPPKKGIENMDNMKSNYMKDVKM